MLGGFSRAYIPSSLWNEVSAVLAEQIGRIEMGSPTDFRNFVCAVIDEASFDSIMGYIEHARSADDMEILLGGNGDKTRPATSSSRPSC